MWLFDKFFDLLQYFGFSNKSAKILFIGLDNAGKTTLLHSLRYGRLGQHAPTSRPTSESIRIARLTLTAFDLGGHEQARLVWREYFDVADALVFLIDASDATRFHESQRELSNILIDPYLSDLPILILGNKIDRSEAMSMEELIARLRIQDDLMRTTMDGGRAIKVCMCSVIRNEGHGDGFRWLADVLNSKL